MNQHDAFIVKTMREQGSLVSDIAYVLGVCERTVYYCIERDYRATSGKDQIADRQESFFPVRSTGNYQAGVFRRKGSEGVVCQREIPEFYSEQESMIEALEEIQSRAFGESYR